MNLRTKSTIVLLRRCVDGCYVNELMDELDDWLDGMIFFLVSVVRHTMTLVRCDRRYFVRTLVVTVSGVGGKEPSHETTIRWLPLQLRYIYTIGMYSGVFGVGCSDVPMRQLRNTATTRRNTKSSCDSCQEVQLVMPASDGIILSLLNRYVDTHYILKTA
jgi:hypothetical protein